MEEKPHILPPPQKVIFIEWDSQVVREALEKSRAAPLDFYSTSTSRNQQHLEVSHDLLIKLANVENLFLIDTSELKNTNSEEDVERRAFECHCGTWPANKSSMHSTIACS